MLKGDAIKFPTTPKERQEGTYFKLVIPQFLVILTTILALAYAITNFYMGNSGNYTISGLVTNLFWGLNNIFALSGIIKAAFWKPEETADAEVAV